jgi:hypothetical protein
MVSTEPALGTRASCSFPLTTAGGAEATAVVQLAAGAEVDERAHRFGTGTFSIRGGGWITPDGCSLIVGTSPVFAIGPHLRSLSITSTIGIAKTQNSGNDLTRS